MKVEWAQILMWLGVALCLGNLVEAADPHPVEVQITVAVQGQSVAPRVAVAHAEPVLVAAEEERPESVTATFEVPGTARVALAAGTGWRLSVIAEELWSPIRMIQPGETTAEVTLLPTVELRGGLRSESGEERPEDIEAYFRSPESEGDEEAREDAASIEGRIDCDVDADAWKCRLPVGTWDVRLRSPGFISHFFWSLDVKKGEPRNLGTLVFQPGSAIFGRLRAEDGEPLSIRGKVTAEPSIGAQARPTVRSRVGSLAVAQQIDERGFFHLKDLWPGSYTVTATHEGYSRTKLRAILVEAGAEVEIDDLVLARPLEFVVRVTPATDLSGKRWHLMLRDMVEMVTAGRGASDLVGEWRLSGLSPGPYALLIGTSDGRRMSQEPIDLRPGSTTFDVELSIVHVEGTVLLGDEPLSATVYFGGLRGTVSIPMASDSEGHFTGWIPRAGEWNVDVRGHEPKVFRRFPKVEVVAQSDVAEVELVLPDTLLEGEVVDEQGQPLPDAVVIVIPGSTAIATKPSTAETDDDGRFALRGNAIGTYRLEARARRDGEALTSDTVEVEVSEEAPVSTTRLVARKLQSFQGRVMTGERGVAGASVMLDGLLGEGVAPSILPQTRTEVDGSFTFDLPTGLHSGWLTVFAPGYVLYRRPVTITDYADILVTLDLTGGELVLRNLPEGRPRLTVTGDGGTDYHVSFLLRWAAMNGVLSSPGELVVPAMPAGAYTVCWPQVDGGETCQQGSLAPTQKWVLDLATAHKSSEGEEP